jgi:hypothetical protein
MYQVLFSKGYYYSKPIEANSVEEAITEVNNGVAIQNLKPTTKDSLYTMYRGRIVGTDILYVRVTDLETEQDYNFMEDLDYEA